MYGMMYLPSKIKTSADAAITSKSILENEFLFRTGIMNGIIGGVLWILLVLILYRLFKQVDERKAKLLVAFVIVQIPVGLIMDAFDIASLMIFKGEILKSFEINQRLDLGTLFVKLNSYGTIVIETFWGLWLFPLALLVYKSGFMPRFIGIWLIINGFAYLILSFTNLFFPQYGNTIYMYAFPAFFGEFAFMLWLLIKGVSIQKPAVIS